MIFLNVRLLDKTMEGIKDIQEITGAASYEDAIRRAVYAYAHILATGEKGYTLTMKKSWYEMEIPLPSRVKDDVVQVKNLKVNRYVKVNKTKGTIEGTKKSPGPYKNLPIKGST